MKRTKEEALETKNALLKAALSVFSRKGYQAAGLQEIAEEANVTRGAIYHHFGGKAEMFTTLVDEASKASGEVIGKAIAEGGSFLEVLQRVLVRSLQLLEEDARFREVKAMTLYKTGMVDELSEYNQRRSEQTGMLVQQTAQMMAQGIAVGALRADLAPEVLARAFIAFQEGLADLYLTNPALFSIAEEAPAFAKIFLNGISVEDKKI